MRNLIEFLRLHYHWFVLLALEVVSLLLLFSSSSYQSSVFVSSANSVVGTIYGIEAGVQSFFSLTRNNEQLSRRNAYLEQQVVQLSEALAEKGVDSTSIASAKEVNNFNLIAAKVVHNTVHKKDNLMTIDKGRADGIKKDMGVISGHGVVGVVYMVGENYSVVIPALSSLSSISCKIENTGYFGHLHWEGGYRNYAYVDDIPRHARFKLYERVVTSGYSSIFPAGVAVGKIMHVYNSADGVSYRLQVQLYTNFSNIRDVYVVDNSHLRERLDILRAAQDTLYKK